MDVLDNAEDFISRESNQRGIDEIYAKKVILTIKRRKLLYRRHVIKGGKYQTLQWKILRNRFTGREWFSHSKFKPRSQK